MEQERREESPVLDNPATVMSFLRESNRLKNVESFQVLLLNTRKKLIRVEEISEGTLDTIAGSSARSFSRGDCGERERDCAGSQSSERRSDAERGGHQGDAGSDPRRAASEN